MPSASRKKGSFAQAAKDDSGGGWFQSGYDAAEQEEKRQEARRSQQGMRRFYLTVKKPGNDGELIFLDGEPFCIREHEFELEGDWKNKVYQTCLTGTGEKCPAEEAGNKSSFVGIYTVIDLRQWKSRDGSKSGKNDIKLFVAKNQALTILRKRAERKTLVGAHMGVSRTGEKSPRVGDVFDYIKTVDLKTIAAKIGGVNLGGKPYKGSLIVNYTDKKWISGPINYFEEFKPLTRKAFKAWMEDASLQAAAADEEVAY